PRPRDTAQLAAARLAARTSDEPAVPIGTRAGNGESRARRGSGSRGQPVAQRGSARAQGHRELHVQQTGGGSNGRTPRSSAARAGRSAPEPTQSRQPEPRPASEPANAAVHGGSRADAPPRRGAGADPRAARTDQARRGVAARAAGPTRSNRP